MLGPLLVSAVGVAALGRADLPERQRRDFLVCLDEFQTFTTSALAGMLAELRKYRVGLMLAHQHLGQLDESVRAAVLGNVGTIVCFRVGADDAALMKREFSPEFDAADLVALPDRRMYLKLMIDGSVSRPFSAEVLRA